MKKRTLSDLAQEALETAIFADDGLILTKQLDGKIYKEVNTVLSELGGKWNSRQKKHLFPAYTDWQVLLSSVIDKGEIALAIDSGFYPTPDHLVTMMIKFMNLNENEIVLEPNGGRGNILKPVRQFSAEKGLNLSLFACEINPMFVSELRLDDFLVAEGDFLTFDAVEKADKIIMNPPFEANGDIKHGIHAFRHLKKGGTMSIITRLNVDEGSTKYHQAWNELCRNYRINELPLPSGSFKQAGTMMETKLNIFQKV